MAVSIASMSARSTVHTFGVTHVTFLMIASLDSVV